MQSNPSGNKATQSSVNASINEPNLLKLIVEELAMARKNIGLAGKILDSNLMCLDSSSTETFLTGRINIQYSNYDFSIPFVTTFLFTCIKTERPYYEIEWGMSLS